uniref:Carnitine O-palmitoyltransferase 1, liver isoform n=1 Tax=Phallusia mammillata TaxID=59560 RepID=A0A6F9D997_9ASCI|nr:carnitine O-palmitoyltransferase 1, liver isoform [Phallusia mammillata]
MAGMSKYLFAGITGATVAAVVGIFSSSLLCCVPKNVVEVLPIDENYCLIIVAFIVGTAGFGIAEWLRWEIIRKLLTYRDWLYNHRSWKTKAWGFLLSSLVPKKNMLYSFQDYLPKYPLPKLEDTCERTLKMIKPLLTDEEYLSVVKVLRDFQKNEGPKLQKILEQRYETEENWMSELWDKYVYLAGRGPLPVHSNFSCNGEKNFNHNDPTNKQVPSAANIMFGFMEYSQKIKDGNLSNMMIQNMVPISCDRYKYICSTTRIPGEAIDELKTYPDSRHIVVFRKKSMYRLDLFATDVNGKETILTPREIQTQLELLMKDAKDVETKSDKDILNPSIFTSTTRPRWAQIRKELLKNKINAESLEVVESAVVCLALGDGRPQSQSEEFKTYLTGNGFDRWFDKSMTFVTEENGAMGYNVEHTSAEATLSGRMWEYGLYHAQYDSSGNATHRNIPQHTVIPVPQRLQWELNDFEDDIADMKSDWDKLADDVDAIVYFVDKGKGFIKKLRVSPDGYMQMALQLTFYRLHKKTPKTYETAATRLFKNARTETIRPVSEHSVAFTKAFDDPNVSVAKKVDHLKKAIIHQTQYKFDAMNGRAVDRHLLGLYIAGKLSGSVPKLFTVRPFYEADELSTSQSPLRYDSVIGKITPYDPVGGGFGPQRQDGYGVAYFMDDVSVSCLITSFKSCPDTGSQKFAAGLQQAVDDIKILLESSLNEKNVSNGKPKHP